MVECDGIMKNYVQVSKNDSWKSMEADGRKQLHMKTSEVSRPMMWEG